jgi:hypothetical protein
LLLLLLTTHADSTVPEAPSAGHVEENVERHWALQSVALHVESTAA